MKRSVILMSVLMLASFGIQAQSVIAPVQIASPQVSTPRQGAMSDDLPSPAVRSAIPVKPRPRAVSFRRDGLWFSTSDGSTHLQVHGYAQADDRWFFSDTHGESLNTFLFRRIRPLFEGTLFNQVDFRFMPDFGQYNPQIQEVYLELKSVPFAKLRVGKFKEPIGLEVLRQDRDLSFTERSIASDLVPLRYIGAQISGAVLGRSITYEGGYFNGSSDGSNAVFTQWTSGNEAAARVFLQPFTRTSIDALKSFGVGLGGSAGMQHGPLAGLKTPAQATFFKYSSSTIAGGQHNRLSPQVYYYVGPFGALGEYMISSQQVFNNGNSARVRNEGWQVQGSVMLTGDINSYSGFHPHNSFEPQHGFRHLGAVELAFRYSRVAIDPAAFPLFANPATAAQQARATGIGLNWHLNRYVKIMTDYEHTTFRMASISVTPLQSEKVLTSRVQMGF